MRLPCIWKIVDCWAVWTWPPSFIPPSDAGTGHRNDPWGPCQTPHLGSRSLTSPVLCSCWAMHLRSSSLARGFSWSCTSYTNCCRDISWLGPLSFLQEGRVEMIFSHRWVIAGHTWNRKGATGQCTAVGTQWWTQCHSFLQAACNSSHELVFFGVGTEQFFFKVLPISRICHQRSNSVEAFLSNVYVKVWWWGFSMLWNCGLNQCSPTPNVLLPASLSPSLTWSDCFS